MFELGVYEKIDNQWIGIIEDLEKKIFNPPYSKEKILKQLNGRLNLICLIASMDGKPVGFKIGYEISPEVFYSWSGGIVPDYREKKCASFLMKAQHKIVREKGFKFIRTKSKNKYKSMLILNLKAGFEIIGVDYSREEKEVAIHFEKELS